MIINGKLLKSLNVCNMGIELFCDYIIEREFNKFSDVVIIVHWSNNRRRNVYNRGLKSLGFRSSCGYYKCLKKVIPKNN
jgi:hypothetical protein